MFITGRLAEYPLSILIEIFLHKGETGLLQISSPTESGSFYFKDGQLIDAALGIFTGAEAVKFGATLANASFQFNSIAPDEYLRRVWESSFERPQRLNHNLRTPAFNFVLGEFSAYVLTACRASEEVLKSLARRVLSSTKGGVRKAFPEIKKQVTVTAAAVGEIGRTLVGIKNKARIAPALLGSLPRTRVSLGLIIIALLVVNLISLLQRPGSNRDVAATETTATIVPNEAKAQTRPVRRHRAKRRSRGRGKRQNAVRPKSLTPEQTETPAPPVIK